jgi:hypothetical protein
MMAQLGYYMPWYLLGSVLALIGGSLLYTINLGLATVGCTATLSWLPL